jgi:CNT family concentrative nucleoside transporter
VIYARGILGIVVLLAICYALSKNRKQIDWKLVGAGMLLQIVFALLVLKVERVTQLFDTIAKGFVAVLGYSSEGAKMLFGKLVTDMDSFGFIFAFQVLPTIVFFSALTSVLYYLGILQRIVFVIAWVMSKTMRLSGAESLAAAGNIFLGQTEAPLLVKPYLPNMTRSEVMCLMTGGMATIAGGVLVAYIKYLGGPDEEMQLYYARHFLTASIMSAPAAIVAAKMLVPETEHDKIDRNIIIPKEKIGSNVLDALSNGTTEGLKLAVNVGAMLLAFTAMMYLINGILGAVGEIGNINEMVAASTDGRFQNLSLQYLLGMAFSPLAWILGTDAKDMLLIGQLLGEKTILNEFFAYESMAKMKDSGLLTDERSIIIGLYALCGFANFASIGIQIGGISVLAPNQRQNLVQLGVYSLIGGTIASFLTAVIAAVLI